MHVMIAMFLLKNTKVCQTSFKYNNGGFLRQLGNSSTSFKECLLLFDAPPFSEVLIESWCMGVQSSYSTCDVAKYYSSEKADKGNRINSTVATNQIELTELNINSNRQEIPIQH